MQPLINFSQIDRSTANLWQEYTITALTKSNSFQEVFLNGISVAIYQADNTTNPDQFKIAGDYTATFLTGAVFHVVGSASNDGDYTTVANATFAGGYTTIYVTNGSITTNEGAGSGTGFIATGSRLVLPNLSSTIVSVFAVARDLTTSVGGVGGIIKAVFTRDANAASTARLGAVVNDLGPRESITGSPDMDLQADTVNGSAKIVFKGGSTDLVSWSAIVVVQQIKQ